MNSPAPSLRRLVALVLLIFAGTAVTVDAYIQSRRPDAFGVVQWHSASPVIEIQPECEEAQLRECRSECYRQDSVKPAACIAS